MMGFSELPKYQVLIKIGNDDIEEIMTYVEVCDKLEAMIEAENKGDQSIFTFTESLIIRDHYLQFQKL